MNKYEIRRLRREAMVQLRAMGWTYEMLAKRYYISRSRAQQIVTGKKPPSYTPKAPSRRREISK